MIEGMRDDTWAWTLYIDGVNFGVFDQKQGGEVDSDGQTYRPGAMADPYALGGNRSATNLTFLRNYRLHRDHPLSQRLINGAGRSQVRAVGQPLDHDKNAWGTPFTYSGTLKRVKFPDHNSEQSGASMLELEVMVTGFPTGMES